MANFGQRVRTGNDISDLDQWMPVDLDYQNSADTVFYVVVAAGGGANSNGGGGGGYRTNYVNTFGELSGGTPGTLEAAYPVTGGTSYTVTIGAGASGANGSNSVFGTITSVGGGAGGSGAGAGSAGGSGGGGGSGGAGTANQGFAGSGGANIVNPIHGPFYYVGGGGAGAAGGSAGGAGRDSTITGASVGYAGGGAGNQYVYNAHTTNGLYDASHGGGGRNTATANGVPNGQPRPNSGGGGGYYPGGSGIVIIRYADTFDDLAYIDPGLVYTKSTASGAKIFSFTAGTGTIQF
tara:strand:- start:787 stop:1665 length:879 start_codon:yes stop_codon:yes gene_type:complete